MMSRFATRCAMAAFIGLAALGFAKPAAAEPPAPSPELKKRGHDL